MTSVPPPQHLTDKLSAYMPPAAAPRCASWMAQHGIRLTIARQRATRLGDYRAPHGALGHRISVNHDLNPYQFLITFVHEVAHLRVWEQHRHRVAPHGPEWKRTFAALMQPFLEEGIFPDDLRRALQRHLANPPASTTRDPALMRLLQGYDQPSEQAEAQTGIPLETLPEGQLFVLSQGHPDKIFAREQLLRKYFLCTETRTGARFRINRLAKVIPV